MGGRKKGSSECNSEICRKRKTSVIYPLMTSRVRANIKINLSIDFNDAWQQNASGEEKMAMN